MRSITNFSQAQTALSGFISPQPGVARYTLERMTQLMNYLGNPQNELKIIHTAGTSGKTSTAYYVASLLRTAGCSVGLTVSPHVDEVNERAQIDLEPLEEIQYCRELSQFLDMVDASGLNPSYFEVLIAFAYWIFYKRRLEYAVIEVGLGGQLDCTNVINRTDKVCIITDIGFDHTEILGETINEITAQKAGIIRPGNTVFMYRQAIAIVTIVDKICQAVNAELHLVPPSTRRLPTLPLFQKRNFQLGLQTVRYILRRDGHQALQTQNIKDASSILVPARMEIVNHNNKILILDGSHNAQKIGTLVKSMRQQFSDKAIVSLVSFGKNKQSNVLASLRLLRSLGPTIIITSFDKGQDEARSSIDPEKIARYAKRAGFTTVTVEPEPRLAFKRLEEQMAQIGLITGSFYLLNHFRHLVKRNKKE